MAIQGFEVTELFDGNGDAKHAFGMLKKVKLADRMRAADTLVKVLGMIQPERIEVSGSVQVQPSLDLSKWTTEDLERLHELQTKYKELDENIIDADLSD
jgi:phage terminase small subunit